MLKVVIPPKELWDEVNEVFVDPLPEVEVEFEHSLLSLSKWEAKYEKPFLVAEKRTKEEMFSYIQCMVVTPGVDLDVLYRLTQDALEAIQAYIESSQSATTFGELPERRGPSEVITSELIYFWMASFHIPFECEKWHLNRLFSLIRIYGIKNSKGTKMSKSELAQRYRDLNAKRRAETGSRG